MSENEIKLGLIGHSISLSLSPAIHGAFFRASGKTGRYDLFDCPAGDLIPLLERLLRPSDLSIDGFNVTIPHKIAVLDYLRSHGAQISDEAKLAGAVNTVVASPLSGHNTDIVGLKNSIADLRESKNVTRPLQHGLLIGTGGAARAAVIALSQCGVKKIVVCARTGEKSQQFCRAMNMQARDNGLALPLLMPSALPQAGASFEVDFKNIDIVINATSIGHADNDAPEWLDRLMQELEASCGAEKNLKLVQDLVYAKGDAPTVFCAAATSHGLLNGDGKAMLVHQARAAFQLWTTVWPSYQSGLEAFEQTLKNRARAEN